MKKCGKIVLAHIKYNKVFNNDHQKKNYSMNNGFKNGDCKNSNLGNRCRASLKKESLNVNHKFVFKK